MEKIRMRAKKITQDIIAKNMPKKTDQWGGVRAKLRDDLSDFIIKETERCPMVLPVIIKV
ncbi:MAG: hypothetical protein COY02_01865 [Parcubacteria group bacterium CG_4_10_14_0_2_um_filter_41_6]|nr:MAG: hypothetical protein COY02_01865 [Parcubacteria group bacterium CG_4_10_14_0_2_um_filter_41_6]